MEHAGSHTNKTASTAERCRHTQTPLTQCPPPLTLSERHGARTGLSLYPALAVPLASPFRFAEGVWLGSGICRTLIERERTSSLQLCTVGSRLAAVCSMQWLSQTPWSVFHQSISLREDPGQPPQRLEMAECGKNVAQNMSWPLCLRQFCPLPPRPSRSIHYASAASLRQRCVLLSLSCLSQCILSCVLCVLCA